MSSNGSWEWVSRNSLDTLVEGEATFTINGKLYKAPSTISVDMKLVRFIRDYANLKGTKFMCLEGGCGSCVVVVKRRDPVTGNFLEFAVNSCLVPIFSCNGWAITTIEALGNRFSGYNKLQARLAEMSGSQCGYCSPGMVMNMYGLALANKGNVTMQKVENSFGGNICRCTGYRPILDTFKSFASDAPRNEDQDNFVDIEDVLKLCSRTGKSCKISCTSKDDCSDEDKDEQDCPPPVGNLTLRLGNNANWYTVTEVREIFEILDMVGDGETYKLVAGNTAFGAYREPAFNYYIDINNVMELVDWRLNTHSVTLGPNMTLTKTISLFRDVAAKHPYMSYLDTFADHIELVANVPVRNIGTIAGNLSIKNQHPDFPSDLFLLFCTVGATFTVLGAYGNTEEIPMENLPITNFSKKLITGITVPAIDQKNFIKTYKIMPCAQNAHAIVNAGFKFNIDKNANFFIKERPRIIFGGINPSFIHAVNTENYLTRNYLRTDVIQAALLILEKEIRPNVVLTEPSPEFRKKLAQSLFYKFVLNVVGDRAKKKYQSGGTVLYRPLSSGKQDFDSDKTYWPVNKPIPKREAFAQCSGEAQYVNDIPSPPGVLYGAFVIAPRGPAKLVSINATAALKYPGVHSFLDVKSIPGENTFTSTEILNILVTENEPIFADKDILHGGQVIGMVLAESQTTAWAAAKLVTVGLTDVKKPLISVESVLESGDKSRVRKTFAIPAQRTKSDVKYRIKGEFNLGEQYHYAMETQACLIIPIEDGYNVYPSTQHNAAVQAAIALCLDIPQNQVNVQNRRIGGAYGSKISRATQIATACAIGAFNSKRPVRMILDLETTMRAIGKRNACHAEYEVGVNESGEIQYANIDIYEDAGTSMNDNIAFLAVLHTSSCYNPETWSISGYAVKTDKYSSTWCRAPGSLESAAFINNMFDHIAWSIKKDPLEVRMLNLAPGEDAIPEMVKSLKESSDYENRQKQITAYNEANRWKKRGMAISLMNFKLATFGNFHALVAIYVQDGTVSITHGGIECGQGMNTKVAQMCAYILGIDVNMIQVKPTNVVTSPNDFLTGGSYTSESVAFAVMKCCEQLNERLEPFKKTPGLKWPQVVKLAAAGGVDLLTTYMQKGDNNPTKNYSIYGTAAIEVELDILTGQHNVIRVDLIEDAGVSINPAVDIGQVEGAFVMGLGYFLQEEIIHDPDTGIALTNRTWTYHPPGAKDIPIDFRITLRKNSVNTSGALRSKATGEPPILLSCGVLSATRNAINSALKEAGRGNEWLNLEVPLNVEKIFTAAFTGLPSYTL